MSDTIKCNKCKLLSCLLFLILGNFSYGQTTIKGIVTDSVGNPIISANIFVKKDNAIVAFTYSKEQGDYILQTERVGDFVISYSALGYAIKSFQISLGNNKEIIQNVSLSNSSFQLDEVIIKSERSITEKKDTVVFNASSFKQGEESVVEDLLKKLPGVDVSTGTIKVDGREVEKVMVEGDDFFKKGYKLLTKNLNVEAIDKVEVLRRYSNNKLLKGIEESEKVALNLKLDEDFKREWFGALSSGYGVTSENTYDVEGNISSFGRKNKYFFIGSLNNIGYDVTDDVRGMINAQNYTDEPGMVGENEESYTFINLNNRVPGLKKTRSNFNNAELVSLNSILKVSEKVNLKVLGLFNSDTNRFFRDGFRTFIINDDKFTNTEEYQLRKNHNVGFGRIELQYDISDTKLLEYEGEFTRSHMDTRSDLVFNGIQNSEELEQNNTLTDHMIRYSTRFKNNKVLLFTGRFIQEETPQDYRTNQFLFQQLFPDTDNVDDIAQQVDNSFQYTGVKVQLLDRKKNKDLLDIRAGIEWREDELQSDFLINQGSNALRPIDYSNNSAYTTVDSYVGIGFLKKINDLGITLDAEAHQFCNTLKAETKTQEESPFFVNTKLNINYKINTSNRIFAYIENSNTNADISDIYSNYILTGYRNFSRGTSTFNQTNATKIFTGYNVGNFGDRFIANLSLSYIKDNDFLSTNALIQQEFIQTAKLIIPDREFYAAYAKVERYIKYIRNNIKVKLSYSQGDFKDIANSTSLRTVKNVNYQYGFEMRSGFSGFFNYHVGTTWDNTEITTNFTNSARQNISFLDISLVFSSRFNIQFQTERYYFNNLEDNKDYYFLDFEATFRPKRNKNLNFSLLGNNILNTRLFKNFSVTDTNSSSIQYRLLPRYILLKASLRF